jgi:2-keto-4-pentenoate hydratase
MPSHPLATALSAARLTRLPHVWTQADGPNDQMQAYRIQAETAALVGSRPIGWKTGLDPKGAPIAGPLLACDMRENGGIYYLAPGEEVIVEVEFAIRLARDLPRGQTFSVADILAATGEILVAIELVGTRYANFDHVPFAARLADNLNHAAFVPGEGRRDVSAVPRKGQTLRLIVDGACVAEHAAVHGDDEPLKAVAAFASQQPDTSEGLRAGQFITTGSLNKIFRLSRAAQIVAEIEGLGRARLDLA